MNEHGTRLTPEDMQYMSTEPSHPAALGTARQDALGARLCGLTGSSGVRGTGVLSAGVLHALLRLKVYS